jgi:outer membrane protein assembly factor BamE
MRILTAWALAACLSLPGCVFKPYKMEVLQGNYLDASLVARLKPGMTRSQVRFILGTPLVTDPFHPDRWDYLYIDRRDGKLKTFHRLTVYFDGDQLTRAVTDLPAVSPEAGAPTQSSAGLPR